jgi:haloacetate dehalogenase
MDDYRGALRSPDVVHAICEDYRASATIDLEHDRTDRVVGNTVDVPLRVLWAKHGVVGGLFDPLMLWQTVATDVSGRSVECGHYLPEEQPDQVLDEIRTFLLGRNRPKKQSRNLPATRIASASTTQTR